MNNKYKILIIEDEENTRKFLAALFEANDYKVLTADTAGSGLLIFTSHLPDLVILNLGLPDFDGTEVLKKSGKTTLHLLSFYLQEVVKAIRWRRLIWEQMTMW